MAFHSFLGSRTRNNRANVLARTEGRAGRSLLGCEHPSSTPPLVHQGIECNRFTLEMIRFWSHLVNTDAEYTHISGYRISFATLRVMVMMVSPNGSHPRYRELELGQKRLRHQQVEDPRLIPPIM